MAFLQDTIVYGNLSAYGLIVEDLKFKGLPDLKFLENKKIIPKDLKSSDFFGQSSAISSNRIVISANGRDNDTGVVYIFDDAGREIAEVTAIDKHVNDNFGYSVSASDNRIVVGAYGSTSQTGAAYIFDINGNLITKIQAYDKYVGDVFGYSVAVSNDRIIVGAYGEDTKGSNSGSAYIFDINGNHIKKILASDGQANDVFGYSVAISDNRIVVGAMYEDTKGADAGAAYIFDIDGNQIAKIMASDGQANDLFGYALAVSNNRIVVSALHEGTKGADAGAAYIFDINGNEIKKIMASDGQANDLFGISVAISDDYVVVGASNEDTKGTDAGAAYIFDINGNEIKKIMASDGQAGDIFGGALSLSKSKILTGAKREHTKGTAAGAAYIFDIFENDVSKVLKNIK